jgi:16S rRNA (cytosine967-C5)-methyltransferase
VKLQRGLLNSAFRALKPGGRLIYATCSLLVEENERQVELALKENCQIKPLPFGEIGSQLKLSGIPLNDHWFTLYPHVHNCDGFFFASLTKSTKE